MATKKQLEALLAKTNRENTELEGELSEAKEDSDEWRDACFAKDGEIAGMGVDHESKLKATQLRLEAEIDAHAATRERARLGILIAAEMGER